MRVLPAIVLLSLVVSGCALNGRSLGQYADDRAISRGVRHNMTVFRQTALAGVTVDTFDGTVYLTGNVETPEQKSDAEIAAWKMAGVEQVINDLRVRSTPAPGTVTVDGVRNPVFERLPGIARVDPPPPDDPKGPSLAYDGTGRLVATVYTLPLRQIGLAGIDGLRATTRPIDHVSIFPVPPRTDLPESEFQLVLWHVSPKEAALLR
jgi:hyperosmotically inducible periplasmic protein